MQSEEEEEVEARQAEEAPKGGSKSEKKLEDPRIWLQRGSWSLKSFWRCAQLGVRPVLREPGGLVTCEREQGIYKREREREFSFAIYIYIYIILSSTLMPTLMSTRMSTLPSNTPETT